MNEGVGVRSTRTGLAAGVLVVMGRVVKLLIYNIPAGRARPRRG
jgi:hypothetical protein